MSHLRCLFSRDFITDIPRLTALTYYTQYTKARGEVCWNVYIDAEEATDHMNSVRVTLSYWIMSHRWCLFSRD